MKRKKYFETITDCGKGIWVTEIRNSKPIRKQGLTDYYIIVYDINNSLSYWTVIDSSWKNVQFEVLNHESLRDANNYLKSKIN